MKKNHPIASLLENPYFLSLFGFIAALLTYTCMYAFRKPLTVSTFEGLIWWGIDYKIWVVSAQVIGYTLSKFIGIKVVSEITSTKRAIGILGLIGFSGLALLGFATVPSPYNLFFVFLNGLPLGMVFGLVFSYLEGRQTTELMAVGLSVTQIFSTGIVKSVGKWTMLEFGISEFWMPVVTGALFMIPLFLFVWMLQQLPPPSEKDIQLRTKRAPMNGAARIKFLTAFAPGLVLLVLVYSMLTMFRDFRDNFSANIWNALGYEDNALIFTQTEIPIFIIVLAIVGFLVIVKDNFLAFVINHLLIIAGAVLIGGATLLFQNNAINPELWMTAIGLGLYMGYVPFSIMLFERLIGAFKYVCTVGFIMYVADSSGYLGSVAILFYKNFAYSELSWLSFFIQSSYWVSVLSSILCLLSLGYFYWKYYRQATPISPTIELN